MLFSGKYTLKFCYFMTIPLNLIISKFFAKKGSHQLHTQVLRTLHSSGQQLSATIVFSLGQALSAAMGQRVNVFTIQKLNDK